MGNREAILEVIRRAYEARGRDDLDALMAAFHQHAVFTLIGDKKALEVTGTVHGHVGVREALRDFIATLDFVDRHILSEVVEGDRAAVHSCIVVRYGPTKETWTADVLDLLTLKDGKIDELIEFATAVVSSLGSPEALHLRLSEPGSVEPSARTRSRT